MGKASLLWSREQRGQRASLCRDASHEQEVATSPFPEPLSLQFSKSGKSTACVHCWRLQAQASANAGELSTVRERKKAPAKAAVTQE